MKLVILACLLVSIVLAVRDENETTSPKGHKLLRRVQILSHKIHRRNRACSKDAKNLLKGTPERVVYMKLRKDERLFRKHIDDRQAMRHFQDKMDHWKSNKSTLLRILKGYVYPCVMNYNFRKGRKIAKLMTEYIDKSQQLMELYGYEVGEGMEDMIQQLLLI